MKSFSSNFYLVLIFKILVSITFFTHLNKASAKSKVNKENYANITWSTCRYSEMTVFLHQLVAKHSTIARLFSIGKSVEGRDLWVVLISDSPIERPLLRPQVKLVGNVIGNYGPSCYVLLRLIAHLLKTFEEEGSLERQLLEMNEIHILANMNPDGFIRSIPGACSGSHGRYNAAGFDLNRDFPDVFNPKEGKSVQPETIAIMNWVRTNSFSLSISMMTGALVVVYPYDTVPLNSNSQIQGAHLTPDDDMFKHLAMTYVKNVNDTREHGDVSRSGWYCPAIQRTFGNGIVNGAEWGAASGTMMDFNYEEGVFEIMVGVTCCRNDNNTTALDKVWEINKPAVLKILMETEYGIRGQVIDADTHAPIAGASMVKSHTNSQVESPAPASWTTTEQGEFWRMLLPGKYILQVRSEGYEEKRIEFEVKPTHFTTVIVEMERNKPPTQESTPEDLDNSVLDYVTKNVESLSLNLTQQIMNVSEATGRIEPSYSKYNRANNIFSAATHILFLNILLFGTI